MPGLASAAATPAWRWARRWASDAPVVPRGGARGGGPGGGRGSVPGSVEKGNTHTRARARARQAEPPASWRARALWCRGGRGRARAGGRERRKRGARGLAAHRRPLSARVLSVAGRHRFLTLLAEARDAPRAPPRSRARARAACSARCRGGRGSRLATSRKGKRIQRPSSRSTGRRHHEEQRREGARARRQAGGHQGKSEALVDNAERFKATSKKLKRKIVVPEPEVHAHPGAHCHCHHHHRPAGQEVRRAGGAGRRGGLLAPEEGLLRRTRTGIFSRQRSHHPRGVSFLTTVVVPGFSVERARAAKRDLWSQSQGRERKRYGTVPSLVHTPPGHARASSAVRAAPPKVAALGDRLRPILPCCPP